MKKISLKNVKEALTRKEMRVIAGGYDCASAILQQIESQYGCLSSSEYNTLYNYYSQPGMCG